MGISDKKIKVTQIRSKIGTHRSHQACLTGLGIRKMHQSVEVIDTPANRGMINRIYYMVKTEEL